MTLSHMRLLIIEDDAAQIQAYEDTIGQHNKKKEPKINYEICRTFAEGESALRSPYFDAAIIDLKLSNTEDLEGKKLVESVYQKIRIPVIIYSGSIAQIDDIAENALLKKRLRTVLFSSIIEEVIAIYNTGITRFLRPEGSVDQKLTHIFWNHLSKDLDLWKNHNNPDTLLRYILSHFQEYLEINLRGDFEEYHPHEVYIIPPIKINPHTGDIVKFEGSLYVILNPACDVVINYKTQEDGSKKAFRKADKMILVKMEDFDYKNLCIDKNGKLEKSKVNNYITNSAFRYHYLPPALNTNGYLIDFQNILTIDFPETADRVATIASPFIKDVISRFANYYSRQGQPTFNQNKIVNDLMAS